MNPFFNYSMLSAGALGLSLYGLHIWSSWDNLDCLTGEWLAVLSCALVFWIFTSILAFWSLSSNDRFRASETGTACSFIAVLFASFGRFPFGGSIGINEPASSLLAVVLSILCGIWIFACFGVQSYQKRNASH